MRSLRRLIALLFGRKETGSLPEEQQQKERDGGNPTGATAGDVAEIVAALDRTHQQRERHHQETDAREKQKSFREKATVGGVWAYTILTLVIAGSSIYQARVFKETERRQLRAYVATSLMTIQCCDESDKSKDIIKTPFDNDG
jgi:hypothetical protein